MERSRWSQLADVTEVSGRERLLEREQRRTAASIPDWLAFQHLDGTTPQSSKAGRGGPFALLDGLRSTLRTSCFERERDAPPRRRDRCDLGQLAVFPLAHRLQLREGALGAEPARCGRRRPPVRRLLATGVDADGSGDASALCTPILPTRGPNLRPHLLSSQRAGSHRTPPAHRRDARPLVERHVLAAIRVSNSGKPRLPASRPARSSIPVRKSATSASSAVTSAMPVPASRCSAANRCETTTSLCSRARAHGPPAVPRIPNTLAPNDSRNGGRRQARRGRMVRGSGPPRPPIQRASDV